MSIQITCKYCGKPDLSWRRTPVGWRLGDRKRGIHQCDKRPINLQEQQA